MERREVIVVGGGQAAWRSVTSWPAGRDFTILEAADEPAAAWRERWESLRLFTPARYDALPGCPSPGTQALSDRDEVAAYLTDYARHFELPVELGSRVRSIRRATAPTCVELDDRAYEADQVVVATGPFQVPARTAIAEAWAPRSSSSTAAPTGPRRTIPPGRVLVVGGGNTGFQIADELAGLARGAPRRRVPQTPLPQRLLGRDLFWYLDATGLIRKTTESRIGRRMRGPRHPDRLESAHTAPPHGVELHRAPSAPTASTVTFADGTTLDVRRGHLGDRLPRRPLLDRRPGVRQRGPGRAPARRDGPPGLYFLGLLWQHTRGSALLGWVKDDAEYIAGQIDDVPPAHGDRDTRAPVRRHELDAQETEMTHLPTITSRPSTRPSRRARAAEVVELADGDEFDLRIAPVAKRLGDATVRMLAYNGSIPGPDAQGQGRLGDRRRHREPGRHGGHRPLARAAAGEPLRRNP